MLGRNQYSPPARQSPDCIVGDWADHKMLLKFASECEVITLGNEFVDAAALEILEKAGHKMFPSAQCIAAVQDKLTQKPQANSPTKGR